MSESRSSGGGCGCIIFLMLTGFLIAVAVGLSWEKAALWGLLAGASPLICIFAFVILLLLGALMALGLVLYFEK